MRPSPDVAARGITSVDVDRAADALLRAGERPTIEKVRSKIGRGSPNTVNPLLDAWWSRLAGRRDAGLAALHRLPEPVLLAAEGLWLRALDDARKRATAEQGSRKASLARDRQDLEVRFHVLAIREKELAKRLRESDSRVAKLEIESLVTLLRKEQASRAAAERRFDDLTPIRALRRGRALQPTAAAVRRRRTENLRKAARNAPPGRIPSSFRRRATLLIR